MQKEIIFSIFLYIYLFNLPNLMNKKYIDVLADRYGILKCIGRGEFGEVWLAHDT